MTDAERHQVIACRHCDRLHRLEALIPGQGARCGRCGSPLFRAKANPLERSLAFTLSALILFVIANSYPLLTFEIEGRSQEARLITGVIGLYDQGLWELAALVLVTSILAPLLQIAGLLYLLLPLTLGRRPWMLGPGYRLVGRVGLWAMLEVYLLGILVALVKLRDFGTVVPDVALYAFFGLIFALAAASYSLEPRAVWQRVRVAP